MPSTRFSFTWHNIGLWLIQTIISWTVADLIVKSDGFFSYNTLIFFVVFGIIEII